MQTLTHETSEKLYKLIPEVLEKCENWWFYRNNKDGWIIREKSNSHINANDRYFPAPTIEDVFSPKFIAGLVTYRHLNKIEKNLSAEIACLIVECIVYSFLDGKLPAVEKYLLKLMEEK